MRELYTELAWLPRPPADFRRRCRAIEESTEPAGAALRGLAGASLDENQLRRLAETVAKVRAAGRSLAPLTPFTLGILGNATLAPVVPSLIASALRHGIALACVSAKFAQVAQEALDPQSTINRAKPDAVLLALDHRGVPLAAGLHDRATADAIAQDALEYVAALRDGFRRHGGALSIVQTIAPPPESLFGSYDRAAPGTLRNLVETYNAGLARSLEGTEDVVLDVAAVAETVGLAAWHAPTIWNFAKLAFDPKLLPLYADHVGRIVGALRGKSRKCLVLDLDNTLWSGVVGDDGLEGIVLGQGDPTGEAHLDVQRLALRLRERGIVLAVSSKNEDATARAVFEQHPEMLLRESHIAVFQANWNDKATNLSAIAKELAIGTDALVFLDDNPAERGLVRELLPEVAVPELPDDPALYARTLAAAGYFESVAFSDEDRARAEMYQENARRVALASRVGDVESYLASLAMRITFAPFDATGRSRIAQLVNKSNQFNLTTRRYTERDVAELEADPACFTLQVRLSDTFGDNGMISVIVCRTVGDAWEIDTWLMSCRVLGRRVESMVLRELVLHARARGIARLVGRYLPTEKNAMVAGHYAALGFTRIAAEPSGAMTWEIATRVEVPEAPMTVDRSAFELVRA